MYNFSAHDAEKKAAFRNNDLAYCRFTLTDAGGVTHTIDNAHIVQGSVVFDRYVYEGEIQLGTTVAAELDFTIDNTDGSFSAIDFEGGEIFAEVGIEYNGVVDYMPMGYYLVDGSPRHRETIEVTSLDRMTKFNKYVDFASWQDSYTMGDLLALICAECGVAYGGTIASLIHADYTITVFPAEDVGFGNMRQTYSRLLSWCAELAGGCAYIGRDGKLYIGWFDTSAPAETLTTANRYDSDLAEKAITLTGIEILLNEDNAFLYGTADYTLQIADNQLIQHDEQDVADDLAGCLLSYTPMAAEIVPMPYLDPLDTIVYTDKGGVDHDCLVSRINYSVNGACKVLGEGETATAHELMATSYIEGRRFISDVQQASHYARIKVDQVNNKIVQEVVDRTDADNALASSIEQTAADLTLTFTQGLEQKVDQSQYDSEVGSKFVFSANGLDIHAQNGSSEYLHLQNNEIDFIADGNTQLKLSQSGVDAQGEITAHKGIRNTDGVHSYVWKVINGKLTLLRG